MSIKEARARAAKVRAMMGPMPTHSISASRFAHIARLTAGNHHVEALVAGATLLGAKNLVKKFELILKLRDLEGHMPTGLSEYSYVLYKDLMSFAKQHLSAADYKRFHAAF